MQNALSGNLSGPHGNAYSVEVKGSDMVIFRNSILT